MQHTISGPTYAFGWSHYTSPAQPMGGIHEEPHACAWWTCARDKRATGLVTAEPPPSAVRVTWVHGEPFRLSNGVRYTGDWLQDPALLAHGGARWSCCRDGGEP